MPLHKHNFNYLFKFHKDLAALRCSNNWGHHQLNQMLLFGKEKITKQEKRQEELKKTQRTNKTRRYIIGSTFCYAYWSCLRNARNTRGRNTREESSFPFLLPRVSCRLSHYFQWALLIRPVVQITRPEDLEENLSEKNRQPTNSTQALSRVRERTRATLRDGERPSKVIVILISCLLRYAFFYFQLYYRS